MHKHEEKYISKQLSMKTTKYIKYSYFHLSEKTINVFPID